MDYSYFLYIVLLGYVVIFSEEDFKRQKSNCGGDIPGLGNASEQCQSGMKVHGKP